MPESAQPQRIALLGAGIFAKTAHLPAIAKASSTLKLIAVYSRSEKSATTLAEATKEFPSISSNQVVVYSDETEGKTLTELLARDDLDTVVLALPIMLQPEIIKKAFQAGKNVISEKPIAPDVKSAKELIQLYEETYKPKGLTWIIAENWTYEKSFNKAKELIEKGEIGQIRSFQMEFFVFVDDGSKYQATKWRTRPDYQGGFLLDGGVHAFAGLRHVLPFDLTTVTAHSALHNQHLPPFDILTGIFSTASETPVSGTFTISFGIKGSTDRRFIFRGTNGMLTIQFKGKNSIMVSVLNSDGESKFEEEYASEGVALEFGEFGQALSQGVESDAWKRVESRSGPRATLRDLAVVEAALKSGEQSGVKIDLKELVGNNFWQSS